MTWSHLQTLARTCAALAAFALFAASPAGAQSSPPGGALPSAERMLQVFEEDALENRTGGTEGIAAGSGVALAAPGPPAAHPP